MQGLFTHWNIWLISAVVLASGIAWFGIGAFTQRERRSVSALGRKCYAFTQRGRLEDAIRCCEEMIARHATSTDLDVRGAVLDSLFSKAAICTSLGRCEDSLRTLEQTVARFSGDSAFREQLARVPLLRANALVFLGRAEEALEAFEQFERDPLVHESSPEWVPALVGKTSCLGQLGRPEEVIRTCDAVVTRFGHATGVLEHEHPDAPWHEGIPEGVAHALFIKGSTLIALGRPQEASDVLDELRRRFASTPDARIRDLVAKALFLQNDLRRTSSGAAR